MDFNFNYNDIEKEEKNFEPIQDGDYDAVIEKSEIALTQKGHKTIKVQLRLNNKRVVFDRLNFESENATAKEIALKKFKSIVFFGIDNPQSKFATIEQMASYLSGTPVKIYYKNKGKDERGYDKFSVTYKQGSAKISKTTAKGGVAY